MEQQPHKRIVVGLCIYVYSKHKPTGEAEGVGVFERAMLIPCRADRLTTLESHRADNLHQVRRASALVFQSSSYGSGTIHVINVHPDHTLRH